MVVKVARGAPLMAVPVLSLQVPPVQVHVVLVQVTVPKLQSEFYDARADRHARIADLRRRAIAGSVEIRKIRGGAIHHNGEPRADVCPFHGALPLKQHIGEVDRTDDQRHQEWRDQRIFDQRPAICISP